MRRRDLLLGVSASIAMGRTVAHAQDGGRIRRIAFVANHPPNDAAGLSHLSVFKSVLARAGWIEGRNVVFDVHWADDAFAPAAAAVVAHAPDVILAQSNPGVSAIRRATATIPIVFVRVGDPIANGHVSNLPRPGGNVTGFTANEVELGGKWLQLLKQAASDLDRVTMLYFPDLRTNLEYVAAATAAAPSLGVTMIGAAVRDGADIERTLVRLAAAPRSGFIAAANPVVSRHRESIIGLAAKLGLPGIYPYPYFAAFGGLLTYGVSDVALYRGAADYVDRILRGEKPGDLPVQVVSKFELGVNLKTAKALGRTIPESFLILADEVIE